MNSSYNLASNSFLCFVKSCDSLLFAMKALLRTSIWLSPDLVVGAEGNESKSCLEPPVNFEEAAASSTWL
jgi:hypothetical protein